MKNTRRHRVNDPIQNRTPLRLFPYDHTDYPSPAARQTAPQEDLPDHLKRRRQAPELSDSPLSASFLQQGESQACMQRFQPP